MDAEIANIINKLEKMKQTLTKLQQYIIETRDSNALALANEIIAENRIFRQTSSGRHGILRGYVPFQCNGSCPELFPNGRVLVLSADAEGLERAGVGYIIRNP